MSESIPIQGFCTLDEKGLVFDEQKRPVLNAEEIQEFFETLKVNDNFALTGFLQGRHLLVEAFDAPLVITQVKLTPSQNILTNHYGISWSFDLPTLMVDEWDRFHGLTTDHLPFVLSPSAQNQLFDQLESFDDDSINYQGVTYPVNPYWSNEPSVQEESFWTQRYQNNDAGWDLGEPAAALKYLLPKLKLPSSRVLVMGGGGGHDAAFFAQQGHHVTLLDISAEALARAKKNYGHFNNLKLMQADLFTLPPSLYGQFDIIFEHTCFCAINPIQREALVRQWRRLLHETGCLFGIFFVMPKRFGPPYGGSEWEIRKRLQKNFRTLIWERFRQSIPPRLGRELLVYATLQK